MTGKNIPQKLLVVICLFSATSQVVFSETVTGNGYSVQQMVAPLDGALSGNGYQINQSGQPLGGLFSVTGFTLSSGLAISSTSSLPSTTPVPTSSGGNNGGGFYVLPPEVTGVWPATTSPSSSSSTILPIRPVVPTTPGTIITDNGSTCGTRIVFSSPIDTTLENHEDDVKRLEIFLNTYEGERLTVNGVYEREDVEAVKRWQTKYRSFILDPMKLRQPTGTIYTLSMRQIERQTTASCGQPILVTACPFFKTNVKYGNRGDDVRKVQQFLNIVQGEKLPLSGVFGPLTKEAVKRFQRSYRIYVATFIPISIATGNWYTTTRTKANETIGCDILK
ncbi:MAG: peptidoglycan-binding protein [Candidatus Pacebacteria bacterium]|jgi:peptidoglycan hydrolase-like protein with peptidoglycan-binding domain|nr:peptidoglycan-binding protein [Candidatus Paceibacterota bacterium]